MPLESTMLIVDNSEYMRNGDYPPTRFEALSDAVSIVFETKCDSNPENMVGIMTMAGKAPEILVTSTRHVGQILQALHTTSDKISGIADIPTAINVAQLALKHRSNKNLRQRIVVFTGSPLEGPNSDAASLTKLAKKLKKNNIAVDVVCFGDAIEEGADMPVLKSFVEGVNSSENSHFVSIPPDNSRLLSEAVARSAVLSADRGDRDEAMADVTNTAGGSGGGGDGFGVDPNLDPELAMALRMSLEEENARRAAAEASSSSQPPPAASSSEAPTSIASESAVPQMPPTPHPAHATAVSPQDLSDDKDDDLQQALALSRDRDEDVEMADDQDEEEIDEEEAIARAIQMSMQSEEQKKK